MNDVPRPLPAVDAFQVHTDAVSVSQGFTSGKAARITSVADARIVSRQLILMRIMRT